MEIKELKPNPKNPRTISPEKLAMLQKAMAEFGDLSGIIYNRKTGQLVGGHQRTKLFDPDAEVTVLATYKKPTKAGTVAEGYVVLAGERFSYREVAWSEAKERAANLAANKGAGEWDRKALSEFFTELESNFKIDLDLTMFSEVERIKFGVKEKPKREEKNGRVSSSDVVTVHLTFTEASANEFKDLVEFFQTELNIDTVTDTVLEVLRQAKASLTE